ncbi:MAG: glycosyltransferase 87 family protein [Rhodococcus sp. (in: high G+C Gram-positive bacteria)]|nr:glycosyltransferase 87 family protein [Rhodococcus sp. (in: high G+C Gram-positive bacteria)]MDI6627479.1 glycosyltransferase 87 family protein [Rhodococcus sp. (in: high G+C Gram-positive bacteria)]
MTLVFDGRTDVSDSRVDPAVGTGDSDWAAVECVDDAPALDSRNDGVERRHSRWFVAMSAVVGVVAFAAHDRLLSFDSLYGLFGNGVDALVYRHGGATVLSGEGLYSFSLFGTLPFTYPPFAAVLFAPLGLLSDTATGLLVNISNVVLLYGVVHLSWRRLGYENSTRTKVVSVALAVGCSWLEPVRMSLWLGQINLLLLALVLWDLGRPEGSRFRGFGVGIAAGLKLTPGLFVVMSIVQKQWRTAWTAAVTGLVTVLIGFVVVFSDAWRYWTSAILASDRVGSTTSPANQSVRGMVARAWGTEHPPVFVWLPVAVVVLAAGMWVSYRAHRAGRTLLAMTLCGLTAPMVSPFSWGHHWVWCVPLLVIGLDACSRASTRHRILRVLGVLAATAPFVAWYRTQADVVVIGTFMQSVSPILDGGLRNAYCVVYVIVLAVAATGLRKDSPIRYVPATNSSI